jgi:hypothetical protein
MTMTEVATDGIIPRTTLTTRNANTSVTGIGTVAIVTGIRGTEAGRGTIGTVATMLRDGRNRRAVDPRRNLTLSNLSTQSCGPKPRTLHQGCLRYC